MRGSRICLSTRGLKCVLDSGRENILWRIADIPVQFWKVGITVVFTLSIDEMELW